MGGGGGLEGAGKIHYIYILLTFNLRSFIMIIRMNTKPPINREPVGNSRLRHFNAVLLLLHPEESEACEVVGMRVCVVYVLECVR